MLKSSDLASHTQDDGFHEIQLNGKQLVFLFMAATVVSVVIFLCGVLVGRGVRAERGTAVETAALNDGAAADLSPAASQRVAPPPAAGSDPTRAAAPPVVDELSYFNRLEKPTAAVEELKETPARQPAAAPTTETARAAGTPPVAETARAVETPPAAIGPGFAVQIAALNVRSEADAMAKRLSTKGYSAFVVTPADGTPSVFRVRIGPFKTRREAESTAARLEKEEQFKPWVTR